MAKTLAQPPLPGDGAWLLQQKFKKRRSRKKLKTFLLPSPGQSGDEVEGYQDGAGEAVSESLGPNYANWKERSTSLQPPDSFLTPTIGQSSLLSHNILETDLRRPAPLSQSLLQASGNTFRLFLQPLKMAPVTRAASLPPHLRNKTANKVAATPAAQTLVEENATKDSSCNQPAPEPDAKGDAAGFQLPIHGEQLRQKLAEEHGIVVSNPKPALVAYQSSNEERKSNPNGLHQPNKSSAATSKRGKPSHRGRGVPSSNGERGSIRNGVHQNAASSVADSARGKPAYRGRGGIGGRQPRQSRWPTAAEQRPDPKRWEVNWGSTEDSFSVDSTFANAGWGDDQRRKKLVQDGIDPDTGFKLTDWSGNWAPAPVDWDSRPAFRDGQSVRKIEQWLATVEEEMRRATGSRDLTIPKDNIKVDGTTFYFRPHPERTDLQIIGDIAPRYWIPINFGHRSESAGTVPQAPQTFWSELVKSNMPLPYEEDDLVGVKPWWETYQVAGGYSLQPYEAPRIDGIDPDENEDEIFARGQDKGSTHHAANRKGIERAKKVARMERLKNAQNKVRKITNGPANQVNNQQLSESMIKPGIKLFVRSARPEDVSRLREIYNYYIDNSVCTPETVRRTDKDMKDRLADARYSTLPFIVAVERGEKVPARRKKDKGEEVILPDRVVGFAMADDYNDKYGMYRFTAELEVFTDKDKYMKGIAKCLLDKLLALLDPTHYAPRGGYEVVGEDLDGLGAQRRIANLIVNVPYDPDTNRLVWLERDILKKNGFEKAGDLKGVGLKDGKTVNLAIFQRKTGEEINPQVPPVTTAYAA